jgi:fermentation-respiration switch protein FrsA (DUF1100 family)
MDQIKKNKFRFLTSWKFWTGLPVFLVAFWLLFSSYLASQSSVLVFNTRVSWAPVPNFGYELNFIKNKAGQNVSLWWFDNAKNQSNLDLEAKNNQRVILYLHGNAGRINDFFTGLLKFGSVLSVAYPGYHESEGDPTTENVYEASTLAFDWLVNTKKVAPENIVIFGHSMGGSPSVYLAGQRPQAQRLVLVNTFSSIQSMCYRSYSIFCIFTGGILNSAENAVKVKIPVRQFVYKNDLTVPADEGRKLFTYFNSSTDKKLIELDKYTHSYFDMDEVLQQALE